MTRPTTEPCPCIHDIDPASGPKARFFVERIQPLLEQISELAAEGGINFFTTFALDADADEDSTMFGVQAEAGNDPADTRGAFEVAMHEAVDEQGEDALWTHVVAEIDKRLGVTVDEAA